MNEAEIRAEAEKIGMQLRRKGQKRAKMMLPLPREEWLKPKRKTVWE